MELLRALIGFAGSVGLIALAVAVKKKTDRILLAILAPFAVIFLAALLCDRFELEPVDLLMHPLYALAVWVPAIFLFVSGSGSTGRSYDVPSVSYQKEDETPKAKSPIKESRKEQAAEEKRLIEAEAAEFAKETSFDYVMERAAGPIGRAAGPSSTFLLSEREADEESDRLFKNAKYGDPVKILYDENKAQYFLRLPFMDYYGFDLKEKHFKECEDILLFVLANSVGSVGSKTQRYLKIAAFAYRKQETTFYQIVDDEKDSDRTIGSTYLKNIGRVSEGKEKRLIEESEKWFLKVHVKSVRTTEESEAKKVIEELDGDLKLRHPERAGIVIRDNHFYGFIVYPDGYSDDSSLAPTDGRNVGLLCIDGTKDGITEIYKEKILTVTVEGLVPFDKTYTYLLEKK